MTRWNAVLELVGNPRRFQDEEGNWHQGKPERRRVYCNTYTLGAAAWASAVDAGLRADAEVQVRAADYHGEQRAELRGTEYDVTRSTDSGEFTRLTLGRRLRNG